MLSALPSRTRPLCALLSAALLLASTALAQEGAPRVAAVDLGQSGIALYTLEGAVDAAGMVRLTVPAEHGDDVLASLVVRDAAGAVLGLRTATPASASEDLRGTPFAGGLPESSAALLQALTGARVRVQTPRNEAAGTVLGTGTAEEAAGEAVVTRPTVLLLDAEGRTSEIVLLPGTTVELEGTTAGVLAQAALSAGGDASARDFMLALTGAGPRPVALSYVSEAPAWKNSWRLLLEEKRLQGWATFENTSGHDWDGVTVTLSTGNPVAYRRDLLDPLRIPRAEPPALAGARPDVRADGGFAEAAPAMDVRLGAAAAAPTPPPTAGAGQAAAVLEGMDVRYRIPQPVDLPAGQTVGLLYLDLPVSPEVQALYQPGLSQQVLLAVRLSAEQALAPGLVSVRDAHGFVGDAPFTGLLAGQSRLLPYAAASGALVRQDRTRGGYRLTLAQSGGLLSLKVVAQERSEYRADLPEGVDVFAVEHPKSGLHLLSASGTVEENAGFLRVTVPVTGGAATVVIVEERVEHQQMTLDRDGAEQLVAVAATGGIEIPEADWLVIAAAAQVLEDIQAQEARIADAEARHAALLSDQDRLRANLAAVRSDDSRRRYETSLLAAEDEIAALLDEMAQARQAIREKEAALGEILGQLG